MASRYDELDASLELEQQIASELREALEARGCVVVHHGSSNGGRHSPGGRPDIEVRDPANARLILVEVTKRRGSAADGEFGAVTEHLNRAVAAGGYSHYAMLYVSPATSARMSTNFRDLYNRNQERTGGSGRVVALDFEALELMIDKLRGSDPALYPTSRLGELFLRWEEAVDDARARQLVQSTIFPEDFSLALDLAQEAQEFDAIREKLLKRDLRNVEEKFRSHGITGNNANITLVYLAFVRLFEERRQRLTGQTSRFTLDGFRAWRESMPNSVQRQYPARMVQALLLELAEEPDLQVAGLLQPRAGVSPSFHEKLTDGLVEELILPVFDEYDFHAGRVDVLGAVFETLARRSEKDTRIGQFFTPQQVVDFCAEMVALRPTDVVLDPAVGTGRFLISAMEMMLDNADAVAARPQAEVESSIRQRQLLGSDIDGWVATIAKMNMFIHGDGKSGIAAVNGLALGDTNVFPALPAGLDGAADVILTNPPLGETDYLVAEREWLELGGDPAGSAAFFDRLGVVPMETVERTQLDALKAKHVQIVEAVQELETMDVSERPRRALDGAYRRRQANERKQAAIEAILDSDKVTRRPRGRSLKGGALFLGACLSYLKSTRIPDELAEWAGGRLAIVVDEAVLNTPDYAPTREFIRRHFFVKAVISLSRDAFKYLAHTDAKTSVLYLIRKPLPTLQQREPVFFAHAERVGYSATGNWVGDDLPQVLLHYQVFMDAIRGLYVGRALDADAALGHVKSLAGHSRAFYARLDAVLGAGRLDYYDARFRERRDELVAKHGALMSLGDVLEVAEVLPPAASRTGDYSFAVAQRTGVIAAKGEAATQYKPSELWTVRAGDLVLSSIDLVYGAVGVAGEDVDGLVMSKEMFAYRVKGGADALLEYMQILLRTQAARDMLMGLTTGTSGRNRLESAEHLLSLPIPPLPSLEAQQERAGKLREAHQLNRTAGELLGSLEEEAQSTWGTPGRLGSERPRELPVAGAV